MSATMTKRQHRTIALLLMAACILVWTTPLTACENEDPQAEIVAISEPFSQNHGANEISPVSYKTAIVYKDENYRLYPTFDDTDDALNTVSSDCAAILDLLQKSFDLEPISLSNWHEYQNALYEESERKDCPPWFNESRDDYMEMICLFDILENEEQNDEILRLLEEEGFESITVLLPSCYDI